MTAALPANVRQAESKSEQVTFHADPKGPVLLTNRSDGRQMSPQVGVGSLTSLNQRLGCNEQ